MVTAVGAAVVLVEVVLVVVVVLAVDGVVAGAEVEVVAGTGRAACDGGTGPTMAERPTPRKARTDTVTGAFDVR